MIRRVGYIIETISTLTAGSMFREGAPLVWASHRPIEVFLWHVFWSARFQLDCGNSAGFLVLPNFLPD
jgi:hypothetical protein